jgi:GTP cyclohydrolase I
MLVWLSKMVLAQHFCISCRGWENAGFAQQNGFGPTFLRIMHRGWENAWLSKMVLAQHFCISFRGWENVQQSLTTAGD